jgi:hypothetical protein
VTGRRSPRPAPPRGYAWPPCRHAAGSTGRRPSSPRRRWGSGCAAAGSASCMVKYPGHDRWECEVQAPGTTSPAGPGIGRTARSERPGGPPESCGGRHRASSLPRCCAWRQCLGPGGP